MTLGKRIRALRKANGLTLKQLSEKIDLSVSFLSEIENDKTNPSLLRLNDLALGLGTSVSSLIGEDIANGDNKFISELFDPELIDLLRQQEIKDILFAIKDIKNWTKKDIDELKSYLKVKKMARDDI